MNSFFDTIEELSRSRKIRDGKLEDAIYEILEKAALAINAQRVNAWLYNADYSQIHCIGNYDLEKHKLVSQSDLPRVAMPKYFKLFESEKLIATHDALNNPQTAELLEIYLKPNHIESLMDIPMRIEGEIIGVVCFENTKVQHKWTEDEKKFGLVITQMVSLAVETHERLKVKMQLEQLLEEQRVLLQEVHHRVKNNLTIVSSLVNLQSEKAKDKFHHDLFQEVRNRINSIATVHQLLYQSKSYSSVNFKKYLHELLQNLSETFSNQAKGMTLVPKINDVELPVSIAIPLSLIVNELVTNSYKHAFKTTGKGTIEIELSENEKMVELIVKDSGPGFTPQSTKRSSVGLEILDALIEQINATLVYNNTNGSTYKITFRNSL
ncbi:MAG: GAF domain-containing protein [Bacteroidia bacterium]|nr:GAF domain-containing protein [Bacteroidia bacterium]